MFFNLKKQKHTSIFQVMMQCFLVFGILFTQTSWALAAEAPVPPANSNANAPKETAAPGAVEKSITDYLCTPDGEGKGTNALIFNCVNKLYRFSIAFGVSVAILFIIFAGYLYMSGSEKGVSEAKSIIENTAAGLLILFVSFLLLRQINPELTRFKSIQLPQIAPAGNTVTPDYVDIVEIDDASSSGGGTVAAGRGLTDAEAKALLKAAGIAWNSGVTMGGIHEAVVNELIAVKQKCNCSITISAVTNGTHASGPCSHANGYKADTGVNSSLDSYVKNFPRIGDRGDGSAQYRDPATGAVWAYEFVKKTNRYHWDMKAGC